MKPTVSRQTVRRWALRFVGIAAVLIPTLWWSATHEDQLDVINYWITYVFYYVGTPAQGLFVVLYLTRPWRRYGPTRAVMNKSFSLFLVMFNSLLVVHLYGQRVDMDLPWWLLTFRIISETYLLCAIFYQLFVNVREIRAGYRESFSRDTQTQEQAEG